MSPRELLSWVREQWSDLRANADIDTSLVDMAELVSGLTARLEAMAEPAESSWSVQGPTPLPSGCVAECRYVGAGIAHAETCPNAPKPEPAAIDRSKPMEHGCRIIRPMNSAGLFPVTVAGIAEEFWLSRECIAALAEFARVQPWARIADLQRERDEATKPLHVRIAELEREREELRTRLDDVARGAAELRAGRNAALTRALDADDAERERDAGLRRIAALRSALADIDERSLTMAHAEGVARCAIAADDRASKEPKP
jgi:hypothetical protein